MVVTRYAVLGLAADGRYRTDNDGKLASIIGIVTLGCRFSGDSADMALMSAGLA
jgi:hypothetical protein